MVSGLKDSEMFSNLTHIHVSLGPAHRPSAAVMPYLTDSSAVMDFWIAPRAMYTNAGVMGRNLVTLDPGTAARSAVNSSAKCLLSCIRMGKSGLVLPRGVNAGGWKRR